MADAMTMMAQKVECRDLNPLHWLILWCLEHHACDEQQLRRATGMCMADIEELRQLHPQQMLEIRGLHNLGQLFTLEMMFELLRQRLAAMLATASRPAELRSILGSLRQLPGAKQLLASLEQLHGEQDDAGASSVAEEQHSSLSRQQRRAIERQLRKTVSS